MDQQQSPDANRGLGRKLSVQSALRSQQQNRVLAQLVHFEHDIFEHANFSRQPAFRFHGHTRGTFSDYISV